MRNPEPANENIWNTSFRTERRKWHEDWNAFQPLHQDVGRIRQREKGHVFFLQNLLECSRKDFESPIHHTMFQKRRTGCVPATTRRTTAPLEASRTSLKMFQNVARWKCGSSSSTAPFGSVFHDASPSSRTFQWKWLGTRSDGNQTPRKSDQSRSNQVLSHRQRLTDNLEICHFWILIEFKCPRKRKRKKWEGPNVPRTKRSERKEIGPIYWNFSRKYEEKGVGNVPWRTNRRRFYGRVLFSSTSMSPSSTPSKKFFLFLVSNSFRCNRPKRVTPPRATELWITGTKLVTNQSERRWRPFFLKKKHPLRCRVPFRWPALPHFKEKGKKKEKKRKETDAQGRCDRIGKEAEKNVKKIQKKCGAAVFQQILPPHRRSAGRSIYEMAAARCDQ